MGVRRVNHTADVALELTGDSLAELLDYSIQGIASLWLEGSAPLPGDADSMQWSLEAASPEGLLVAWANEAIYSFDVLGFLATGSLCTVESTGHGWMASGTVTGRRLDPHSTFIPGAALKAATWGSLRILQDASGCSCILILDT